MGDPVYDNYSQKIQDVLTDLSTLETDVDTLKADAIAANDGTDVKYITISKNLQNLREELTSSLLEHGTDSTRLDSIIQHTLLAQSQVNSAYDGIQTQIQEKLERQEDIKKGKLKMAQVNSYFSKSYDAKKMFMQYLVMYIIIIIVVSTLSKYMGASESVTGSLTAILLVYSCIMLFRMAWDMYRRDVTNYDEIDWWWRPGNFEDSSNTDNFQNKNEKNKPIVKGNNEYFATYSKF
tara:strand:+ start:191 stop:898 length:708 start_codon:yes stop_codon:yes gene_type:complete